ncbi:P-loop containing nucleoside triphosphate hydrolase protein, partial [Scleroderma yunnanense]
WRVTEMSDIILLLLDSRCPPLHLPPSLASYLSLPDASTDNVTNATRKPKVANVIFVLTKVDIPGPARVAAWTSYLNTQYPCVPVVPIEAYAPKKADPDGPAVQGRVRYKPHIAETFRERLVDVLKVVHAKMLIPPDWIKGSEEKKCGWKPKVRADVDWERVRNARDVRVGRADGAANPEEEGEQVEDLDEMTTGMQNETNSDNPEEISKEPEFLTVGLIGQPNVGKSSLLNALFGTTKVRASRTPGKTKHFQTLFWTPDVRLVDCPGLVMPSFVPIDIQVLCSVFPISRMAAIPFCVHQISQLLPLEDILALTHPSTAVKPVEDKRTWRDGQRSGVKEKSKEDLRWTAVDIMTAYADKNGWVTAKAGRPDVNRAGNASEPSWFAFRPYM